MKDIELIEQLKPFLIDKQNLSLQTQIGGGQFGKVYRGTLRFDDGKELTVAAKTLKGMFVCNQTLGCEDFCIILLRQTGWCSFISWPTITK